MVISIGVCTPTGPQRGARNSRTLFRDPVQGAVFMGFVVPVVRAEKRARTTGYCPFTPPAWQKRPNSRVSLLRAVKGAQEELLGFAVDEADVSRVDVPHSGDLRDGDDRLGHRRMAAGGADASEGLFQNTAGSAHIADVTDGHNVVGIVNSAHERPFNTFKRQTEVGHLRYQIVAL